MLDLTVYLITVCAKIDFNFAPPTYMAFKNMIEVAAHINNTKFSIFFKLIFKNNLNMDQGKVANDT